MDKLRKSKRRKRNLQLTMLLMMWYLELRN